MKILLTLIIFALFLSCECKNESIEPTKIVELNDKEINALTETSFIIIVETKKIMIELRDI